MVNIQGIRNTPVFNNLIDQNDKLITKIENIICKKKKIFSYILLKYFILFLNTYIYIKIFKVIYILIYR